jgi:hypothetical protein
LLISSSAHQLSSQRAANSQENAMCEAWISAVAAEASPPTPNGTTETGNGMAEGSVCDSISEALAGSNTLAEMVREARLGSPMAVGETFIKLLDDVTLADEEDGRLSVCADPAAADAVVPSLIDELAKAEWIILVMLNLMTPRQKNAAAEQLAADGTSPDGMTRYHERRAALDSAGAQ